MKTIVYIINFQCNNKQRLKTELVLSTKRRKDKRLAFKRNKDNIKSLLSKDKVVFNFKVVQKSICFLIFLSSLYHLWPTSLNQESSINLYLCSLSAKDKTFLSCHYPHSAFVKRLCYLHHFYFCGKKYSEYNLFWQYSIPLSRILQVFFRTLIMDF